MDGYSPLDANYEVDLRLRRDVVVTCRACNTAQANFLALLLQILLHIGIGTLESDRALLGASLYSIQIPVSTDEYKTVTRRELIPRKVYQSRKMVS